MSRLSRCVVVLVVIMVVGSSLQLSAGDWPQFRYDAQRSAASPEQLPAQLVLHWQRRLPKPRPAFPLENRLLFDASYEPVVLGNTMFVPSMVTDSIIALNTATGSVRWRFVTDGPVRFAPVARQGKVYTVSDDGHLYCLAADSGRLLWKFRGLPAGRADRKLLGNGRLISLWPARGGPVLVGGTVYFAAGLWPDDGVFLYALNADSGRVVWKNDTSNHITQANMDHGVRQYAGLTPQGYLAVLGNRLVVPCGAQLPAFLNLKTGVLDSYTMGWGGRVGLPKGSWFVAAVGKYLCQSGDLYDVTRNNDEMFHKTRGRRDFKHRLYPGEFTRIDIDPANQRVLGSFREPVMTAHAIYYNDGQAGIVADDLTNIILRKRADVKPALYRRNDRYPDKWKGEFRRLWNLPSKLTVHIRAGSRLYAGGKGIVQAINIPQPGQTPRVSWQTKFGGTPHRMLAAGGRLFVVTDDGRILAYGAAGREPLATVTPSESAAIPRDTWSAQAAKILRATGATAGYALVLGLDRGRLVEELLRQSSLSVIAVDPDAHKVAALRKRLLRAGVYGLRVAVHTADPLTYPFPPYLAQLIVSERPAELIRTVDQNLPRTLFHHLRPYGGTACLSVAAEQRDAWVARLSAEKLPGASIHRSDDFVMLLRPAGLPRAADWSHAGGNAANAGASQDRFLKAPLAMLWFDSSFRWHRKVGSAVVRVSHGRVFVKAQKLYALDVFTGRRLWQKSLELGPVSPGELVAVDDAVYITGGTTCREFDPGTGHHRRDIHAPTGTTGSWANVRVWKLFLVGTLGKSLVCLNRKTGKMLWTYECGRAGLSTSVGRNKVFCSELTNRRRGEVAGQPGRNIRAFDIRTGKLLWKVADGSPVRYSEPLDLVVTARSVYRGQDGSRLRDSVPSAQIIGEQLVSGMVDRFSVFDLLTGNRKGNELKWYRRGCTGLRSSCHLVTTRFKGNAAYVDLETRKITSLWNIRSGCNNNLFPADGILNIPNVTGGCECNYTPTSKAFAPRSVIANTGKP